MVRALWYQTPLGNYSHPLVSSLCPFNTEWPWPNDGFSAHYNMTLKEVNDSKSCFVLSASKLNCWSSYQYKNVIGIKRKPLKRVYFNSVLQKLNKPNQYDSIKGIRIQVSRSTACSYSSTLLFISVSVFYLCFNIRPILWSSDFHCSNALGMESNKISDDPISASSSFYDGRWSPRQARLNFEDNAWDAQWGQQQRIHPGEVSSLKFPSFSTYLQCSWGISKGLWTDIWIEICGSVVQALHQAFRMSLITLVLL